MQCFCPCHNRLIKEKVDHVASGCPKCATGNLKECNEAENMMKEKLLRLCRLDDCLKAILAIRDEESAGEADDMIGQLSRIFTLAETALIPTILCVSCKNLTVSSPCEKCGSELL